MKKILCFGDSNTYGFNPVNGRRYPSSLRWSGILKEILKNDYIVIEEGCNNRTCYSDNPQGKEMTGFKILPQFLNADISIIILQIGINDIQTQYKRDVYDIQTGINKFIKSIIRTFPNIKILLISPPIINNNIKNSMFYNMFDEESIKLSYKLNKLYYDAAEKNNCIYIDINKQIQVSNIDGLHYTREGHKKIAEIVYNTIRKLFLT